MRLLILTQKVDAADDILGFFHSWIREFAQHCERVTVVCLEKGAYSLPDNVEVVSLGKEQNADSRGLQRRFSQIEYLVRFIRYIVRNRKGYDAVFVHMNPEYVVLGGLLWRLWRKKIALWYVHREVNWKLRIAEKLAHIVFSTTAEAFRLKSKKTHFLGHGVDLSQFAYSVKRKPNTEFRILHVGRITPIKNLDVLIEAAAILKQNWDHEFKIILVGAPSVRGDREYEQTLKDLIEKLGLADTVSFTGKVSFTRIAELYKEADVSVNLTPTGGMDKAVLESIASGTIALSANQAFKELFGKYANYLLYSERDPRNVAEKLMIIGTDKNLQNMISDYLYQKVKKHFSLKSLIKRIVVLLRTI